MTVSVSRNYWRSEVRRYAQVKRGPTSVGVHGGTGLHGVVVTQLVTPGLGSPPRGLWSCAGRTGHSSRPNLGLCPDEGWARSECIQNKMRQSCERVIHNFVQGCSVCGIVQVEVSCPLNRMVSRKVRECV